MRLNTKIFFTLFPTGYWIVIAVGVVFHFLSEVSQYFRFLQKHEGRLEVDERILYERNLKI